MKLSVSQYVLDLQKAFLARTADMPITGAQDKTLARAQIIPRGYEQVDIEPDIHENHVPQILADVGLTEKDQLGGVSASVHAEVYALIQSEQPTDGNTLIVSECPCPNCASISAIAGISRVHHDTGEWYNRRKNAVAITHAIQKLAGVRVSEFAGEFLNRVRRSPNDTPRNFELKELRRKEHPNLKEEAEKFAQSYENSHLHINGKVTGSAAIVTGQNGARYLAVAATSLPPGMTTDFYKTRGKTLENKEKEQKSGKEKKKYHLHMNAFDVLLANIKREGLDIRGAKIHYHANGPMPMRGIPDIMACEPRYLGLSDSSNGKSPLSRAVKREQCRPRDEILPEERINGRGKQRFEYTKAQAIQLIIRACKQSNIAITVNGQNIGSKSNGAKNTRRPRRAPG